MKHTHWSLFSGLVTLALVGSAVLPAADTRAGALIVPESQMSSPAPAGAEGAGIMSETATQVTQSRPARPAPLVSPEVHADRRVTFRLQAPAAKEVTVWGDWGGAPVPLTRDAQGPWSATLGPLPAEVYQYGFIVDGLRIPDLANPQGKPQRSPTTSVFEIPGTPPLLHEFQEVPHGTLHRHQYRSRPLRGLRPLVVYTPPGYGETSERRYPVLYLFHGSGDSEGAWTVVGRAHLILDNLIAQKKARPMVIVMPDGHVSPPLPPAEASARALEAFEQDLLDEVVPFVELHYRVRADREHRGIVGLSMGGSQALTIGLRHRERFAFVGGFSSAARSALEAAEAAALEGSHAGRGLKLLWFACGKDDRLLESNQQLDALLTRRGVRHEFHETEGNHSWPLWRRYLPLFVSRLFP